MAAVAECLRIEDAWYSYGDDADHALSGVSLRLAQGDRVALIGPSGCGKTTLLYLAAGLLKPSRGTVASCGLPVSELSPDERSRHRRQNVGFVFQFGELIAELSLRDNVALGGELAGLKRGVALTRADDLLEQVGLSGLAHRKPGAVSGGQAQRCALARAFCHRPALILADEPTGSLDQANARAATRLIGELADQRGATVLLVTHDRAVAESCHQVIGMIDGRIRP
ncbi:MAG: ABC transporter ATP-binding protein [Bifidobacteriaceae bacterium]|jgi:putative ABC transport system ATP-binding protein|nr:ABC transporter ATP-binding protein [Bifidobacteriaceae bacterium]